MKAVVSRYVGVIVLAGIIFIAGGRIKYWQAILYLGLAILGTILVHVLSPADSKLAAYRAKTAKSGEPWDRRIVGLQGICREGEVQDHSRAFLVQHITSLEFHRTSRGHCPWNLAS